jgi:sugar phosphate isomerase/epimerase
VNYGVVDVGKDEASARKVFDFAKAMGIETIVSEPDPGVFGILDKLTNEYGINVAIHNHPKESRYWNPQTVLDAVKGHSHRIGSCADTGHWPRSGVNPLAAIKMLKGRIISLHFKDLNELNKRAAHDVVWGTGVCDAKAMLAELKRQGFSGVFSIEYEYNWENSMPEIGECVKAFHAMAKELGVNAS